MDNKICTLDDESQAKVKIEDHEEAASVNEDIDYDPFEAEEMFVAAEDTEVEEDIIESIEEDYHFVVDEIVVDDTKENAKGRTASTAPRSRPKDDSNEFIILELDNNVKLYQCDICQKTFKDRSKLRSHREIHTEERNVICPDCGKGFKTMNCLRNHKRLHMPERTYFNCDQCEKRYTQKIQLKKHIEIVHMLRRDFVCNTCGSSFGTNSVLKMHLLSHQDFRAEKCEICGFRFHTKAKLRRHMKSHTGERDYECSICFKKFLYSYNVVAHIRNVHEKGRKMHNEPYSCSYCSEKFWRPQKLSEHLLSIHQIVNSKIEVIEEEEIYE